MKHALKIGKKKKKNSNSDSSSKVEKKLKKKGEKVSKKDKTKGKRKARTRELPEFKVRKSKMNRAELVEAFMSEMDLPELTGLGDEMKEKTQKNLVKAFLEAQSRLIMGHIAPKGSGKFQIPGLLNITVKKVPAKPKRKAMNPFTKKEQWFDAKPATVKVRARPMRLLKDVAAS